MQPAPAGSLLLALRQIPDPRGRQGRRHPLAAMLAAVVCAMLCGARGYSAIAQWIHLQQPDFWYVLGFTRKPPKKTSNLAMPAALHDGSQISIVATLLAFQGDGGGRELC